MIWSASSDSEALRACVCSRFGVPTNAHRERPLGPVPSLDDWHLAFGEGAGPIECFVGVAVFCGIEAVGVGAKPVVCV